MDFQHDLMQQIKRHPSMQPQDVIKLCYQGAYGAEHLLEHLDSARAYLEKEYACVDAADTELYEIISPHVCRIHLAAWKYRGLPLEWLFHMFTASASITESGSTLFLDYLQIAEELIARGEAGFHLSDWQSYLSDYKAAGMNAVHHSGSYRANERPAYRIIHCQYLPLLPILETIARKRTSRPICVIAIDGPAASGKSTLAKHLKTVLDADIVQMDDFFLPPELRTEDRFRTPGGNIHHERFLDEVISKITKPEPFSYRIFDCGLMALSGEKPIESGSFRIVEGSYSCHPVFGHYADVTVALQVEPEEQMRRILARNGAQMAELFRQRWIPLEEAYFDHFSIAKNADLQIKIPVSSAI